MKIRRSLAIGLTAASLALAAIGGISASAATPQDTAIPSENRDVVFTSAHVSDLETIIPTGLSNTLSVFGSPQMSGPDARS
jgi:hypothetical protein